MASEIRVNQIQSRTGLSTVTFSDAGVSIAGIVTASQVNVGSATTLHSTGLDLGSGNINSHNINSTGIITSTGGFSGNVTGNVNATGISTFSGGIVVAAGSTAAPSISPSGDSNTGVFFPSADTIGFAEGGAEAARFDSSGRFGIGTTPNSDSRLHVKSGANDSNPVLRLEAATGNFLNFRQTGSVYDIHVTAGDPLSFTIGASERMRIASGGDLFSLNADNGIVSRSTLSAGTTNTVFIGQHSATSIISGTNCFKVYTNGNVQNTNNSYGALSDIKLKENVVDANSQWDDLKALQVRNYNLKEGQTHTQIGLVAQEVELVSPGLVSEAPDRDAEGNDLGTVTKSVNYSVLYMKAVKALQEAMERIEQLETEKAAQQTVLDDLLARVTALEAA
jgi:hypothetical protein